MNVAVVTWRFPVTTETFVLDHVTGLLERGHRVQVVARTPPAPGPVHADFARHRLDRVTRAPARRDRWARRVRTAIALGRAALRGRASLGRMRKELPREALSLLSLLLATARDADVVHAHFGPQGELVAALRTLGLVRAPLVVSLHGFDVTRATRQAVSPYRHLFAEAARIVVTTKFLADEVVQLGCPAARIERIPVGVRLEQFPFAERRRAPGEPLRLLTVARLVEQKGVEYAIRAVAQLIGAGVRLEYSIAGAGPLEPALRQLAQSLGVESAVRFLGALDRAAVQRQLAASHLFLFSPCSVAEGDREGQGLVVQEAQASGLPVIATRHGGIAEGMAEGESGLLVPERDAAALAEAVRTLLRQEERWPAMGQAGRMLVEKRFSHHQHIARLEALYSGLR